MKEQHFTIKSHFYNEDRFLVTNTLFAVIDGATGLTDENTFNKASKASKLAGFVKSQLANYKGTDIIDFLHSLSILAFEKGHTKDCSCGISIVKVNEKTVELYCLGDCPILYQNKNGEVHTFTQTKLPKLDKIALNQMMDYAKANNISIKKARKYIDHTLKKHRALLNTPDGYWVFAPSEKPNFTVDTITIEKEQLKSIIVCSDGFAQCYNKLNIFENEKQLFESQLSVKDICLKVQRISKADKDYNLYPRFKLFDDTTVIKLDF
ncbi:MAG: hypothetical protein E7348_02320 [Clostridiales bacterium]|nr:hypothetical protein [Clostridiales bacterium]